MESSDINAAFREVFVPLRRNIRHGMSTEGQVYALEMDSCAPGELLGTDWIPPAARGIGDAAELTDPERRRALFAQLLAEQRSEALFAYVCECRSSRDEPVLFVEIVSSDACYVAEYPIGPGVGWHFRELKRAPHRRIDRRCAT